MSERQLTWTDNGFSKLIAPTLIGEYLISTDKTTLWFTGVSWNKVWEAWSKVSEKEVPEDAWCPFSCSC